MTNEVVFDILNHYFPGEIRLTINNHTGSFCKTFDANIEANGHEWNEFMDDFKGKIDIEHLSVSTVRDYMEVKISFTEYGIERVKQECIHKASETICPTKWDWWLYLDIKEEDKMPTFESNTITINGLSPIISNYLGGIKYGNWADSNEIHITGSLNGFDITNIYVNRKKEIVVVKWSDGETTKVKRRKGDKFDLEAAVNAAIVKRLVKSHTNYQKQIEKMAEYQN